MSIIHTDLGWQVKGPNGTIYSTVYANRDAARIAAKMPADDTEDLGSDLGIEPDSTTRFDDGTSLDDDATTDLQEPEPEAKVLPEAYAIKNGGNGYQHRETWLHALADRLTHDLFEPAYEVPANIRYSCGFPSRKATLPESGDMAKVAIGQCWGDTKSGDGNFEIFISPVISDPMTVAATMAHEICHAVAGIDAKHGKAFKQVATHVLLEGKMTATVASQDFIRKVQPILDDIGPYPMATLDARRMSNGTKKQTTRMIKVECPMCQYVARVAKKWIDEVGAPHCPDHGQMEVETPEND